MSAAEKIYNILSTRQLLYVLLIIMVLIPLLHPFGIPISISSRVKAVYEYIEKKLPDHPKVLIEIYYDPAAATELEPGIGAILRHLVKKHPKLVFVSLSATGPIMFERLKRYVPDVFKQLKYGEDYVYLGFLTGGEAACASLARGIKEFVPKDNYGNPTANMPIFKYADKAKDFDLVITCDDVEPKPSEEGYLTVMKTLGLKPDEILYVGDRWEVEVEPAKKLGMKTALVSRKHHGDPDIYLKDVMEILDKLDELDC